MIVKQNSAVPQFATITFTQPLEENTFLEKLHHDPHMFNELISVQQIWILQIWWQPLPVNAGPGPLGLDGHLQQVCHLLLPLLLRLPLHPQVSPGVDCQDCFPLLLQHLAVVSVAVVVQLEPEMKTLCKG